MSEINIQSQKELREQISDEFGKLLEFSKMTSIQLYNMCNQLYFVVDLYMSNAEILTENQKTKEFHSL